jgi:hypothetical protein
MLALSGWGTMRDDTILALDSTTSFKRDTLDDILVITEEFGQHEHIPDRLHIANDRISISDTSFCQNGSSRESNVSGVMDALLDTELADYFRSSCSFSRTSRPSRTSRNSVLRILDELDEDISTSEPVETCFQERTSLRKTVINIVPPLSNYVPESTPRSVWGKKWTVDQDRILRDAVTEVGGPKNWKLVASMVPGRSGVQCRQRWERLKPGRVRGKWSPEEDLALMSAISSVEPLQASQRRRTKSGMVEPCWSQVAAQLPARTAKQCRYRWLVKQKKMTGKNQSDLQTTKRHILQSHDHQQQITKHQRI